MMSELKPCYCGKTDLGTCVSDFYAHIFCIQCGLRMSRYGDEIPVAEWNTRDEAELPALRAENDRLRHELGALETIEAMRVKNVNVSVANCSCGVFLIRFENERFHSHPTVHSHSFTEAIQTAAEEFVKLEQTTDN